MGKVASSTLSSIYGTLANRSDPLTELLDPLRSALLGGGQGKAGEEKRQQECRIGKDWAWYRK